MSHQDSIEEQNHRNGGEELLAGSGYSAKAIRYFIEKPYIGELSDADQVSQMTGTCGDTMKIWLKVESGVILDARYQVLGCPGAVASAMAVVELIKGKTIEEARKIHDGDVFRVLEDMPSQKNHCIQLAVKTCHTALDAYSRKNHEER